MKKKNTLPLNFLLVLVYFILTLLLFDPKPFIGGDNAVYIALGESLAMGRGYKNIYLPEESPHTQYPPGFPLLLSVFILIFGKNIIILKAFVFLTGLGALLFMFGITREIFKEKSKIVNIFYLSIPIFIIYNHWVLSEIPFLFFSLGALYFFMKMKEKSSNIYFILSSLFSVYAFFIRTAGIALIIAFLIVLILRKRYVHLLTFLIIFLVFFIPWELRNIRLSQTGGYLDQLLAKNPYQLELGRIGIVDLVIRVFENFTFYVFTIIPTTILPILKSPALLAIAGFLFLLFTLIGFLRKIKNFTLIEAYFIFGVVVLLVWPKVWSGDRFLLPIIPIFIIYIFSAIFWLQEKITSKFFVPVFTGIIIFLNLLEIIAQARPSVANNITYLKADIYAGYSNDWRNYFEMIEWISKNIPKDKIVMARKPEFVYLLSGHKSFCYPFTPNIDRVKESIKRSDYILLDRFQWTGTTYRYLLPAIQKNPELYKIVHQIGRPEFYLLKVEKL